MAWRRKEKGPTYVQVIQEEIYWSKSNKAILLFRIGFHLFTLSRRQFNSINTEENLDK